MITRAGKAPPLYNKECLYLKHVLLADERQPEKLITINHCKINADGCLTVGLRKRPDCCGGKGWHGNLLGATRLIVLATLKHALLQLKLVVSCTYRPKRMHVWVWLQEGSLELQIRSIHMGTHARHMAAHAPGD